MTNLFTMLYRLTEKTEKTNFCPLYVCGCFINTALSFTGENIIEIENTNGGCGFIFDNSELMDFLKTSGVDADALYNDLQTL